MKVVVDNSEVRSFLDGLDPKKMKSVLRSAFRSAAGVVQREAQKNYKRLFPSSQRWRGIVVTPYKKGDGASIAPAFRLGRKKAAKVNEKAGSNIVDTFYVLAVLEKGVSTPRSSLARSKVKKGNRGTLRAYCFLSSALASKEQQALKNFDTILKKKIKKMNQK